MPSRSSGHRFALRASSPAGSGDHIGAAGYIGEEAERRLKVVRENYVAFNNGDIDGVMRPMHPDVEMIVADENAQVDPAQHRSGTAEVRAFFDEIKGAVGLNWIAVEEMTATGNAVVVTASIHGRMKESGEEGSFPVVHRYTFERDEIIRIETFRPEWQSQLG
ncbi:MAG TPA: nuclear transport factor 2 family protein [Solirubrobacterales bacterium]|nr:nuclear transport factor 2 family protein [Solirubrobacterales bacterium]